MKNSSLLIERTGVICSVGLTAPSACAAMRAKVTNPIETNFIDSFGQHIRAHEVALEQPWRGLTKLARMAAMSIEECLAGVPDEQHANLPLLLCVAERERPGRLEGLEDQLFDTIERLLGRRFSTHSSVVPHGRVSIPMAMASAARLLAEGACDRVLLVGVDSLMNWPTLAAYEKADRLLTEQNSNGFMPGEGAAALLVSEDKRAPGLRCTGIGFSEEPAHIESGNPLRCVGLTEAVRQALSASGCQLHEMDLRIADLSGEQYYLKEAALLLSRAMRQLKESFDIWHPAECTGETGAASGAIMLALIEAACRKGYAPGVRTLAHFSADAGGRAALTLEYAGAA